MVPLLTFPLPRSEDSVRTFILPNGQRELLNRLRMAGMGCRVAAHTDLFEACALLTLDGEDARRTYLGTFVKCLPDAVGKRIVWFSPGSVELSFDEAWILGCLTSIWQDDTSSLTFLLRSRVASVDQRYIGFLMTRISEQFAQA